MHTVAASITTASAPWWFVAALAGILTVLSTIVGASITFWSNRLSDRRSLTRDLARIDREERRLDREELRHSAGRFLVAARQYVKDYQSNFEEYRPHPGEPAQYRLRSDAKPNDIHATYEAYWDLAFYSIPEVSDAARGLLGATRKFELSRTNIASGRSPLDSEQFRRRYDAHISARQQLVSRVMAALAS